MRSNRLRLLALTSVVALLPVLGSRRALAVQPVFDPNGASFYDLPFPYELRRDGDGTVSIAGFPNPFGSALVASYLAAIEEVADFGVNSGVFFKFDGDLDPASLPADPETSRQAGASVFLINIDPRSKARGQRTPLWIEFRSSGDAYRDDHLLGLMPVPGHTLDPATLYAVVVTDTLRGSDLNPLTPPPFVQRMRDETPQGSFEESSLELFEKLWRELEMHQGLSRESVVVATVFRTANPIADMVAVERLVQRRDRPIATDLVLDEGRSGGTFWVFTGHLVAPQFQTGTPPFSEPGAGKFTFDAKGIPIILREETLELVLCVPKETGDGTIRMPNRGWPIVPYMHGTGGSRFSVANEGVAGVLAGVGVASLGIDQPLHGLRAGATPDGSNFYNPLYPFALRDNPRQAAADSLLIHRLVRGFTLDPSLITISAGAGYLTPTRTIRFNPERRLFMGHSQGAATGPLFLGVARGVRGGLISAGGGHLLVNVLTREQEFFAGLKLRDLVEILLGTPVDLFHPGLHLLQMGSEVSDPLAYASGFATRRKGKPQSLLFTHGILDGYVTTPMTASLVVAARYPLIAPTFPPLVFPFLPGYSYQEAFDLAGLATLTAPVSGNLGGPGRRATGGLVLFENDGHFPIFSNPEAIDQWSGFMRSLAYDPVATIPARP